MKAYMVKSNKTIEPFEDHPRECLIANKSLKDLQESILSGLGIELVVVKNEVQIHDSEEHLVVGDSLYFNRKLIDQFVFRSRQLKSNTVCVLKAGLFTLRTVTTTQDVNGSNEGIVYNLRYKPSTQQGRQEVPIVCDADGFREVMAVPAHMLGAPGHGIPLPEILAIQVDHWTNLWAANMAALLAPVATVLTTPKWKLMATALKAGSTNKWKIASKLNLIGRNCDIHPTAYLEGSVIGDNVKVGAGGVIKECNIASNATVENGATLVFSVVGEGSFIADGTTVRYSKIYPDTFLGFSTASCQTFGKGCFVGVGVGLADYRLDGKNITVLKNGIVVDTGNRILGSCFGHNSYLAAGTRVAPGRAIPNGARLVPENYSMITKVNPDGSIPNYRQVNRRADEKPAA